MPVCDRRCGSWSGNGLAGCRGARTVTLADRIKALRLAQGLTVYGLAKTARLPITTLRDWEQRGRLPDVLTARRLATALGVTLDELVAGVDDPVKEATA